MNNILSEEALALIRELQDTSLEECSRAAQKLMTMKRNKEKSALWPLRYGAKASTLLQTLKPVNKAEATRILQPFQTGKHGPKESN